MCTLTKKLNEESVTGYKVVTVDKEGRFWSSAMGFQYVPGKKVPVIKKQKRLHYHWHSDILSSSFSLFSLLMVGRTSAFQKQKDAQWLYERMNEYNVDLPGFSLAVVKVVLSTDLMKGYYTTKKDVFAGRVIKSIELM